LLFQAGYMTIGGPADRKGLLPLRIPNREVSIALHKDLFKFLTGARDETLQKSANLLAISFESGDAGKIEEGLSAFFSVFAHRTAADSPGHFSSLVYCALSLKGFDISVEESVGSGDIDMRITMPASAVLPDGAVYIAQWKHRTLNLIDDQTQTGNRKSGAMLKKEIDKLSGAGLRDALSQIETKGCATPWLAGGKKIIRMGICTVGSSSVIVRFAE